MAGERILAVDDEIFYRTLLHDLLSQEGYIVQLAESGEMALKAWSMEKFDLILTDHPLEGINGLQILERVKEKDPLLPVVIVGPRNFQQALYALKKGAADFIEKPFQAQEFKSAIRSIIDRSRNLRERAFTILGDWGELRILGVLTKAKEILVTHAEEQALQSLLDLAMEEVSASRGGLLMQHGNSPSFLFQTQRDLFPPLDKPPVILRGQGIAGGALSQISPTILDPIREEGIDQAYLGRTSTLILPIQGKGEIIGGFILGDKPSGEAFTLRDIHSLTPITAILSLFWEEKEKRAGPGKRIPFTLPSDQLLDQVTLEALLDKEIKKSQRYRRNFSLALINYDQLKAIIERYGTLAPQEVLPSLQEPLLQTIRSADTAALMHNGEIGLLLPETNYQGAVAAAWRIRHAIRESKMVEGLPLPTPLPIVFGIASFPEHGISSGEILERAAQAMTRSVESASRFENLWGYIDKLLKEARITSELMKALSWTRGGTEEECPSLPQDSDQPLPAGEHNRELQFVGSWEDFHGFRQYMEECILQRLAGEGVFYVGLKSLKDLEPKLERFYGMLEHGIKIFVFFQEAWKEWDARGIAPVLTQDPALDDYKFFVYYGVSACYALVGRERGDEGMCGFFTISDFLVNEIRKKLSETYL